MNELDVMFIILCVSNSMWGFIYFRQVGDLKERLQSMTQWRDHWKDLSLKDTALHAEVRDKLSRIKKHLREMVEI